MKTFLDIENKSFSFSNCNDCPSRCCDGREGTVFSQLILEDFEVVSKNFSILFIFGELGYTKSVVLFSDGKSFCSYIKDGQCSIYEQRPSICRNYPLSPNIDNNTYLDDSCPAISINDGSSIVNNGIVTKDFMTESLDNYQDKYVETHFELDKLDKKDFELLITINNVEFFKYNGNIRNQYVDYHISSLKNNLITKYTEV